MVQFQREATSCDRAVWFVISGWISERWGPRAVALIIALSPWGRTPEWQRSSSHFYQVRLDDWAHPVHCQWPFPFKEPIPRTLGRRDESHITKRHLLSNLLCSCEAITSRLPARLLNNCHMYSTEAFSVYDFFIFFFFLIQPPHHTKE